MLQNIVPICLKVTKRRLLCLDEIIDQEGEFTEISDAEWTVIGQGEKTQTDIYEDIKVKNAKRYTKKKKIKKKPKNAKQEQDKLKDDEEGDHSNNSEDEIEDAMPAIEVEICDVLRDLANKYPQTKINGQDNIWIVKPASLSRGRGIKLFNSLVEIQMQVKSKDLAWVI